MISLATSVHQLREEARRWWREWDRDEKMVVATVFAGYLVIFAILVGLARFHGKSPIDLLIVTPKDATEYAVIAQNMVVHGRFTFFGSELPEVFRTPLYPAFLATVFGLVRTWYVVPVVQSFVAAFAAALVLRLSKRFVRRGAALVSTALFVLDPMMILGAYTTLTDILYVAVMVWVIYRCVLLLQAFPETAQARRWQLIQIGVGFGVAALIRPIGLPFVAIAAMGVPSVLLIERLVSWKGALRAVGVLVLASACVLFPWFARNRVVAGAWTFSTVSSYNMIAYNLSEYLSTQEHVRLEEAREQLFSQISGIQEVEQYRSVSVLPRYAAIRRTFFGRALVPYAVFHARESVTLFVASGWNVAKSVVDRLTDAPRSTNYNRGQLIAQRAWGALARSLVESPFELVFAVERILYGVVALLAMLAVWLGERRYRWTFVAMLGFVWYVVAATGPVAMARYRLPIWPFLLLLAAVSVSRAWKRFHPST